MKELITVIFMLMALSLKANDFKKSFYDLLDKGDLELAEIFLSEWETNNVDNPDLFLAKFNLLMSKAFQTSDNSNDLDNPLMVLEPNDSILQLAIESIKKGIDILPNRLDFRLAESQAYIYSEDMESLSESGIEILEHSRVNDCRWDWSEGESLDSEEGLKNMLDGIHTMEDFLMLQSIGYDLLDLNLKYYPTDAEALLLKGMALAEEGKYEKARNCLEIAHESHPDNDAVMFYLGVVYSNMGDSEKEKEILRKIVDSDKADENLKKTALKILEGQDSDLKEIDLYQFEFSFLKNVANKCSPSIDSLNILLNKDNEIFNLLEQIGYYLPEDQKEIKTDVIGEGDDAIVVWTMPEPKEIPLARYIAFIPDKEANNYRLYTLERSLNWDGGIDPVWILGYSYNGGHSNFGEIPYPSSAKEFVDMVLKVYDSKK